MVTREVPCTKLFYSRMFSKLFEKNLSNGVFSEGKNTFTNAQFAFYSKLKQGFLEH